MTITMKLIPLLLLALITTTQQRQSADLILAAGWFPNERISIDEACDGALKILLKVAPKEYLTTDLLYTIVGESIVYENPRYSAIIRG